MKPTLTIKRPMSELAKRAQLTPEEKAAVKRMAKETVDALNKHTLESD